MISFELEEYAIFNISLLEPLSNQVEFEILDARGLSDIEVPIDSEAYDSEFEDRRHGALMDFMAQHSMIKEPANREAASSANKVDAADSMGFNQCLTK